MELRVGGMAVLLPVLLVLLVALAPASAFYLPGVAPIDFEDVRFFSSLFVSFVKS
jgi:hypothetical protein